MTDNGICFFRRYPVLLQGPTSTGKTSLIQYLANQAGQKCVRINNHEHTDLQEYVGAYTANSDGQLVFQEGTITIVISVKFDF
jgi:midasin